MKNKSKLRKLSGLEVLTQKKALTFIHIPFENMPTKRWTGIYILYYFNLVEAIIGHQKLHLTCRKLRSFCTGCTSIKTRSYLAIKSSSMLTGKIFSGIIRHDIITFWGWKPYKKNIDPDQNFTGFYEKGVGALNKLQNP